MNFRKNGEQKAVEGGSRGAQRDVVELIFSGGYGRMDPLRAFPLFPGNGVSRGLVVKWPDKKDLEVEQRVSKEVRQKREEQERQTREFLLTFKHMQGIIGKFAVALGFEKIVRDVISVAGELVPEDFEKRMGAMHDPSSYLRAVGYLGASYPTEIPLIISFVDTIGIARIPEVERAVDLLNKINALSVVNSDTVLPLILSAEIEDKVSNLVRRAYEHPEIYEAVGRTFSEAAGRMTVAQARLDNLNRSPAKS